MLPVTSDLRKLSLEADNQLLSTMEQHKKKPSYVTWRTLARAVFVVATLFNRRRGGEVARMLTICFTEQKGKDIPNEE